MQFDSVKCDNDITLKMDQILDLTLHNLLEQVS